MESREAVNRDCLQSRYWQSFQVGKNKRNHLAWDVVRLITFISDNLITEKQRADNYICNN